MRLRWVQFPLHPNIPEGGVELSELFRGRAGYIEAAKKRLQEMAEREGLPMGDRTRTYNSRLAQELGKWADARGNDAIHAALFRAYFVDGKDIGDRDELIRVAEGVGLPGDEARRVLEEREYAPAVDNDWDRARGLGVTGVPTFLADDRAIVGLQPYELLERLVEVAGASRRPEQA